MAVQPLVTIGLPIYNAQRTLADAIDSVLAQSYENWELLLMDDGSTDGSARIAQRFDDPRIRWISDGSNRGISSRLNQAVALARGEYFCRMDADDMCFPDRIKVQLAAMQADPALDLVAASVLTFSSDWQSHGIVRVARSHAEICGRPWNGFHFPHPTWLGRISWFRAHPYSSAANGAEDQLLLYQAQDDSVFGGVAEVLLAYRDDRGSFGKLLGRRLRFWKVIGGAAIARRNIRDALLVCLRQPAKILADFLFVYCGMVGARNRLQPADDEVQKAWDALAEARRS